MHMLLEATSSALQRRPATSGHAIAHGRGCPNCKQLICKQLSKHGISYEGCFRMSQLWLVKCALTNAMTSGATAADGHYGEP